MKNFPQGIFQSIEWLIKQVDKLRYQISNSGGGGSVVTDGTTVQGNGTLGSPLKSYESVQNYANSSGVTIQLLDSYTFHYIYDGGDLGTTSCTIYAPINAAIGQKLTLANKSGFNADLSGFGDITQLLNGKTAVFIYTTTPSGLNNEPAPVWYLLDIY